jgi:MFS transporter, ACS family, glucarate transporter
MSAADTRSSDIENPYQSPLSTTSQYAGATRARQTVLAFAVTLAVITYIDRVCISQAAPDIRRDLGLDSQEMGWVFSAFALAYALFEIPGGRLGDRFGPRSVLMKVVMMWSFFTAATGWAWNLLSMLVCRFLFGVGEAGCFPNLTKIFTIWLPSDERVRAQGILWLSARWGGAFTPPLVALVLAFVNWRWAFGLFGLIGAVWAIGFYRWFRDDPSTHPSVNAAELAMLDGAAVNAPSHGPVPWGRLITSSAVWLLWIQYFCMSYGWYFYITWLPTYLREARGLAVQESAILAGLPLFVGGIGCFVGGWLTKYLAEASGNVRRARRTVSSLGLAAAGVLLIVGAQAPGIVVAIGAIALASFCNDLMMANAWGACMDVGGRHCGSLSGSMNMMGNLGAAVGSAVTGFLLEQGQENLAEGALAAWMSAFVVTAVIYGIGAICWMFLDPVTPLEEAS